MTPTRKIVAGLLGGLAAFIWSTIAHTVLPLGEAGVSTLPNETAVLTSLQSEIKQHGLYLFPAPTEETNQSPEAMMAKYRASPSGILVYNPPGRDFSFPRLLGVEAAGTLFAGLIAAALLGRGPITIAGGALLGANLGIFTWLCVSLSYWNWYDFPRDYVWAEGADQIVGWLLGGIVIALVLRRERR